MQTFSAANNLTIEADNGLWRLFNRQSTESVPLVEATRSGLTYQAAFARARNLPEGMLAAPLIDRVIVGWAVEDKSWHLGLLLTADYAQERGGRWCGLLRWFDAEAQLEGTTAEASGKALAEALDKPFRFVPAELPTLEPVDPMLQVPDVVDAIGTTVDANAESLVTLPDVQRLSPPIAIGEWALTEGRNGLNWERSRAWRLETLSRTVFFGVLAIIFGLLAAGELRTNYASVQPDWLPLVGVIVAVLMALNALYHLAALLLTSAVQFDRRNRMIRFVRRPMGVTKQVPFEKVDYVLVSHAISRREPLKINGVSANGLNGAAVLERIYSEVWIHVARDKGDFLEVGHLTQTEGRAVHMEASSVRRPLDTDQVDTPGHQAAHLLAEVMEVQVFVEDRT